MLFFNLFHLNGWEGRLRPLGSFDSLKRVAFTRFALILFLPAVANAQGNALSFSVDQRGASSISSLTQPYASIAERKLNWPKGSTRSVIEWPQRSRERPNFGQVLSVFMKDTVTSSAIPHVTFCCRFHDLWTADDRRPERIGDARGAASWR